MSRYVTAVHINWNNISLVQSAEGDRVADAIYDEEGNEDETYDLMFADFQALLSSLKAKGIRVIEKGSPVTGEYYLDSDGILQYNELVG